MALGIRAEAGRAADRTSKEMESNRDTFARQIANTLFGTLHFSQLGYLSWRLLRCLNLLFKSCPLLLFSHLLSCMRAHHQQNNEPALIQKQKQKISRSLGAESVLSCV
jgi:hypothetical protein